MAGYGLATMPARAGPTNRKSVLLSGNICELVAVQLQSLVDYTEDLKVSRNRMTTHSGAHHKQALPWRESSPASVDDDDIYSDASIVSLNTSVTVEQSFTTSTPILLLPPSDALDEWSVSVGRILETQGHPETFIIQSSVPFVQALDDLCVRMSRLSVRDSDSPPSDIPRLDVSSAVLEDVCRLLDSVSLQDTPPAKPAEPLEEDPKCAYISIAEESDSEESVTSDSTYVEEDSCISWATVCVEEHKVEEKVQPTNVPVQEELLQGTVADLVVSVPAKRIREQPAKYTAPPMHIASSAGHFTASWVGLRCWMRLTSPSFFSLFAPGLHTISTI